MLEGFPSCQFKNLYVDYTTHIPQHPYFTGKGLMPTKVENEAAFFTVSEKFHGIKVDEVVLDAGYGIVSITFDAPLDIAEAKMREFLKYGYNKEPLPAGGEVRLITPTLKPNKTAPKKTDLTCDFEPNY